MCERCGFDEQFRDLDWDVAHEVFGLPAEQVNAWPWSVPFFSSSRSDAGKVLCKMLAPEELRVAFDKEISGLVPVVNGGLAEGLLVATPDIICKAALAAVRSLKK